MSKARCFRKLDRFLRSTRLGSFVIVWSGAPLIQDLTRKVFLVISLFSVLPGVLRRFQKRPYCIHSTDQYQVSREAPSRPARGEAASL